jgi:hypothetical protein
MSEGKLFELPLRPRGGPAQPRPAGRQVWVMLSALVVLLGLVAGLGAAVAWLVSHAGLGVRLGFWQGVCFFLAVQVLLLPCYLSLGKGRDGSTGLS